MNKHNFIGQGVAPNTLAIDTVGIDTMSIPIVRLIIHESGGRTLTFANRLLVGK